MQFKNPENQIARWLEILSEFDFEIQHRAGQLHGNDDAVSRIPCSHFGFRDDINVESNKYVFTLSTSPSNIRQMQENDDDLQTLRSWLEGKGRPDSIRIEGKSYYLKSLYSQYDRLCIMDGIICRRWDDLETKVSRFKL